VITHSTLHHIKLLPADKQNLQTIMDNSTFLDDSIKIATLDPPCPPLKRLDVMMTLPVTFAVTAALQWKQYTVISVTTIKVF
jgi:hypothetical protein